MELNGPALLHNDPQCFFRQQQIENHPTDAAVDACISTRSPLEIVAALPKDLIERRAELFEPQDTNPLRLTREELLRYWPFVNNAWCEHKLVRAREGHHFSHCYCRCRKDGTREPAGQNSYINLVIRKRHYRTLGYNRSLKVIFRKEGYILVYLMKPHQTHDVDHMDKRHMSYGIRTLVVGLLKAHSNNNPATNAFLQELLVTDPRFEAIGGRSVTKVRVRSLRETKDIRKVSGVMEYLANDENFKSPRPDRHPRPQNPPSESYHPPGYYNPRPYESYVHSGPGLMPQKMALKPTTTRQTLSVPLPQMIPPVSPLLTRSSPKMQHFAAQPLFCDPLLQCTYLISCSTGCTAVHLNTMYRRNRLMHREPGNRRVVRRVPRW